MPLPDDLVKTLSFIIFNNCKEAILVVNSNNIVVMVNKAYEQVTGYTYTDTIGRDIRTLPCLNKISSFEDMVSRGFTDPGWSGECINYKSTDHPYSIYLSINPLEPYDDISGYKIIKFHDISDKKRIETEILYYSQYDDLTGLPNRRFLSNILQALIDAQENSFALLFIDIDKFKPVNDIYGHVAGDSLLQQVSHRLKSSLRQTDFASRYGGDEFIVILRNVGRKNSITVTNKLYSSMTDMSYNIGTDLTHVEFSIGVAIYPMDGITEDSIISKADTAMYMSKKNGGGVSYWDECNADNKTVKLGMQLSRSVKSRDFSDFFVVYQPQIDIVHNIVIGCEALLRWKDKDNIVISPSDFIPILESTNMIIAVGEQVLRCSCFDFSALSSLTVSVNISIKQLKHRDFIPLVLGVLDQYAFPYHRLDLEITETLVANDLDNFIVKLNKLRDLGVKISLDDFGAGYSSLSRLIHLPIDKLKIDSAFMMDFEYNDKSKKMIDSVIRIGKILGLAVIAEGVEKKSQVEYLINAGCDQVQGYYFGKPMELDKLHIWLDDWKLVTPKGET